MGLVVNSSPRPLTPQKETWYPMYRRLDEPHGRSGRVRNISPAPGFDSRTVQPIAYGCTDWAIPAHVLLAVVIIIIIIIIIHKHQGLYPLIRSIFNNNNNNNNNLFFYYYAVIAIRNRRIHRTVVNQLLSIPSSFNYKNFTLQIHTSQRDSLIIVLVVILLTLWRRNYFFF